MAMAKIFATQIKRGTIKLEDVPTTWRKEVEVLLNERAD